MTPTGTYSRPKRAALGILLTATLICAMPASPASAQAADVDAAGVFLWSGSTHSWTYNHRINRLGDYVGPQSCDASGCGAELVHTGASGSGPDSATTTSSAWSVRSQGLRSATGSAVLHLTGARGAELSATGTVTLPADAAGLAGRDRYVALLNGYDLVSNTDPGKFGSINFGVGEATYDATTNEIRIPVSAEARLHCASPECMPGAGIDYDLTVYAAVLAADADAVAATPATVNRSDDWADYRYTTVGVLYDPDHGPYGPELDPAPERVTIQGRGGTAALLGLRRLSLNVDKDQHMIAVNTGVNPVSYTQGRYTADVELLFKNWTSSMWSDGLPYSLTSYGQAGHADWSTDLTLIEFQTPATVTHHTGACTIRWPGLNKPADDPAAICSTRHTT